MKIIDSIKNFIGNKHRYKQDSASLIIAVYFNPTDSEYRHKAFRLWYESIKHLEHVILEIVIGDTPRQLEDINAPCIQTDSMLWHKEAGLNWIINNLSKLKPRRSYENIFWLDTDVVFTNMNWLVEASNKLKTANIVQPFEYCVHLEQDQLQPMHNLDWHKSRTYLTIGNSGKDRRVWRSFAANRVDADLTESEKQIYDISGHVGFAWGIKLHILKSMHPVSFYDRALIGGADNIIARAAVNEVDYGSAKIIFEEEMKQIRKWSKKLYGLVEGKIAYVVGDLYHIWHGDVGKREYYERIKHFTPLMHAIINKDDNGLWVASKESHQYVANYMDHREVGSLAIGIREAAVSSLTENDKPGNFTRTTSVLELSTIKRVNHKVGPIVAVDENGLSKPVEKPSITPYDVMPKVEIAGANKDTNHKIDAKLRKRQTPSKKSIGISTSNVNTSSSNDAVSNIMLGALLMNSSHNDQSHSIEHAHKHHDVQSQDNDQRIDKLVDQPAYQEHHEVDNTNFS